MQAGVTGIEPREFQMAERERAREERVAVPEDSWAPRRPYLSRRCPGGIGVRVGPRRSRAPWWHDPYIAAPEASLTTSYPRAAHPRALHSFSGAVTAKTTLTKESK